MFLYELLIIYYLPIKVLVFNLENLFELYTWYEDKDIIIIFNTVIIVNGVFENTLEIVSFISIE